MAAAATRTRQDAASFRFNSRLAARFHQRQAALVAAAERLADRVRRLYDRLAAELAQTAAEAGLAGLPRLEGRVDVELEEIRRAIQAELTLAGRRASREAADAILAALPPEWLPILLGLATAKTSTPESVEPIMEADPWSIEDELAAIRGWQTGGSALDRDAAMNLIRSLLFPPPSAQDVNGWLTQAVPGGLSWDDRLRHWEQPARAAMLSELTIGLAAGENVDQLRGRIKPFADGVAWKAQRIARTEANRVAERASRATIDGMGGLVDGLQIVAVMDQWTRPEHAARNGRVYRRGQDGVYRDDRGNPLPDLPDAPNCRCMTIPVLTMPEAFKEDPALRAAFETATGKLIPDPASYADWWERAGQRERMTAVGVRRYQAVRDRLGRAPQWADFIDVDGTLVPIDHLHKETEAERIDRRKQVDSLLAQRKLLFAETASKGQVRLAKFMTSRERAALLGRAAETHRTARPERFAATIAKLPPERLAFVTEYTADQYREMREAGAQIVMSKTGKSGCVVKPDGDIISVFSLPGAHEGRMTVEEAIRRGGRKLDCFDVFLPGFYSQAGFQEVSREPWNDAFAPPEWDYAKLGRPDIVFMRLPPER